MTLQTPVEQLHGVGKTLAKRLLYLGVETVQDLLFYFPFRYEDFSNVRSIRELRDGEQVTVRVKIALISNKRSPRKRLIITEALVTDESGEMRVVWFGQPFIAKALKAGDTVHLSGKVKSDMLGVTLTSPSYEKAADTDTVHTGRIVPMYSLTAGITHKQIRFLIKQVVELVREVPEWLPQSIQEKVDMMPLPEALRAIHFPENADEQKHAERRLKFDELFVLQLRAEMIRRALKRTIAPAIAFHENETKSFVASLPFALTNDQKVAAWEILKDMQKSEPMNRMLQGDVGSGKTAVAALSAHAAVAGGYQVAIMAPTEILAKQHYESFLNLFKKNLDITVGLVTGSKKEISDREIGDKETSPVSYLLSQSNIIIGTHALLTEDVKFKKLGLVIVDEQHRFGVEQRKIIKEKSGDGLTPHFLSMTATPIPRSLALTLYGDLDISIIHQMPAGRKTIKTRYVAPHHREKAYAFIREQVKQGRQVFVICPLIENASGKEQNATISDEKKSVMSEYEKLSKKIFPDLRVGFLHGKMKAKDKDEVMRQFASGELDILVSTSVVEVGVNIPNASVMMIEGADRFGLAQLHQFRGRVGRSEHQSYCFVFSDSDSGSVRERLEFFEKNIDGFKLAEFDLNTRGPGEVYGATQSGMMQFRLATMKDVDIIKLARDIARDTDIEKYPILREKVQAWEEATHLE